MATKAAVSRPVLRLVPTGCPETIALLERVLGLARSGDVVGVAIGLYGPGGSYVVDVTGTLKRDPTRARGVVAAIDDQLREEIQAAADAAPELPW